MHYFIQGLILGAVIVATLADPLGAKTFQGPAPIRAVSVFTDRAFVTRVQSATLAPGTHKVIFKDLTPLLDPDSLKVRLSEKNGVMLLGLSSEDVYTLKEKDGELVKLRAELETTQKQIREILNEVQGLVHQFGVFRSMTDHYRDSFIRKFNMKSWRPTEFKDFLGFLDRNFSDNRGVWKRIYDRYQVLSEKQEYLEAKVGELESVSQKQTRKVIVRLEAKEAKTLNVELSYLVTQAGWSSAYDVRIDSQVKQAQFTHFAEVWQQTGEVWKNVELTLSTVLTKLRVEAPTISSYSVSGREVEKVKTVVTGETQGVGLLSEAERVEGEAIEGLAKTHRPKGLQTIEGGMRRTRVEIARRMLPYREELRIVPVQMSAVYRHADFENRFDWPLQPGTLNIFYDGEFIGATSINQIATGGTFGLNVGVEHAIAVVLGVDNKVINPSAIQWSRIFQRIWALHLKNFSKNRKEVKWLVQVPVSQLDGVDVTVDRKETTGGFVPLHPELEKDPKLKDGWLVLPIGLAPREEKRARLAVEVKTPKDFQFHW